MSKLMLTEDEVRNKAFELLGFNHVSESTAQVGTGQITTLNQLGFSGSRKRPDGWYLPIDLSKPAIILETKAAKENITNQTTTVGLFEKTDIVSKKYNKVIGILYNANDIRIFKNNTELLNISKELESYEYYLDLFSEIELDKENIYNVTRRINNNLHFQFGMNELKDRMIFTACALVAQRYNPVSGLQQLKNHGYSSFHNWIYSALSKAIERDKKQNDKLDILLEEFAVAKMAITENQDAINIFIDDVCEIADLINSDNWHGEDVMAIFFNEFNRYRKKEEFGQVFTPDHITSFMCRLINVNKNDKVLDATCGSGAFLVKAMCNMIQEAGGVNTNKAKKIKNNQLYGIEMYRKVFALACANMMIHKDGKTNLLQEDAKSTTAADWIADKEITKVLMNPPFEKKYKCADIISNVLDSVPQNTQCAIILPDRKLEKEKKFKKVLEKHTLKLIIKLPEKLFFPSNVTTSIFVFETGHPQNSQLIVGYNVSEDGLVTVKNKGRQDKQNNWQAIEDYWIEAINSGNDSKYSTKKLINPADNLSYPLVEKDFYIEKEDFFKTVVDYILFKEKIDTQALGEAFLNNILYNIEDVKVTDTDMTIKIAEVDEDSDNDALLLDPKNWEPFKLGEIFKIKKPIPRIKTDYFPGNIPFVSSAKYNNGIIDYFAPKEDEVLDSGKCITVNPLDGSAFYQEENFLGRGGAGSSITILSCSHINKFSALFICTIIRVTFNKFNYDNMGKNFEEKEILLPSVYRSKKKTNKNRTINTNESHVPDWKYMETYIRNIYNQKSDKVKLMCGKIINNYKQT